MGGPTKRESNGEQAGREASEKLERAGAPTLRNVPSNREMTQTADREKDFCQWLEGQAKALRTTRPSRVDWAGIAEELEAMARKDRTSLRSHLQDLLTHLLKWAYQPGRRSKSWVASINQARDRIEDLLEESPSLAHELNVELAGSKVYGRAVRDAALDTGGKVEFPRQCPWTVEQLRNPKFLP